MKRPSLWRRAAIPLLLFLLSYGVRLALLQLSPAYRLAIGAEMHRVARSIAVDHAFANPFFTPTGPTAHVAPAYPAFVALIYMLFGISPSTEFLLRLIMIAAVSLQYALLPLLAPRLCLPRATGILAGFLGALLPLRAFVELGSGWEAPFAALVTMALCAITIGHLRSPNFGALRACGYGALWGFALLLAPALITVLAAFVFLEAWWLDRGCYHLWIRRWAFAGSVIVLCLAPWIARNYLRLGKVFFIRDNFGLELAMSNNDLSGPTFEDNDVKGAKHPNLSASEAALLRTMGETAYNDLKLRQTLSWIRNHPTRFAKLTLQRALYFWVPPHRYVLRVAIMAGITLAAIAGLFSFLRAQPVPASLFLVLWLVFPLVYYSIQYLTRYRYPIDWTLLLMVAYSLQCLAVRFAANRGRWGC